MEHVLFAVAIFIANIIQGLTGFAGSLLAMPPSINILGLIPAKGCGKHVWFGQFCHSFC